MKAQERYQPYLKKIETALSSDSYSEKLSNHLKKAIPKTINTDEEFSAVFKKLYGAIDSWSKGKALYALKREQFLQLLENDYKVPRWLKNKIKKSMAAIDLIPSDDETNLDKVKEKFEDELKSSQKKIDRYTTFINGLTVTGNVFAVIGLLLILAFVTLMTLGLGLFFLAEQGGANINLMSLTTSTNYVKSFSEGGTHAEVDTKEFVDSNCEPLKEIENQFMAQIADEHLEENKQRDENYKGYIEAGKAAGIVAQQLNLDAKSISNLACVGRLFRDGIYQHPVMRYSHRTKLIVDKTPNSELKNTTQNKITLTNGNFIEKSAVGLTLYDTKNLEERTGLSGNKIQAPKPIHSFTGTGIQDFAISHDQKVVAAISKNNVTFWEISTGRLLSRFKVEQADGARHFFSAQTIQFKNNGDVVLNRKRFTTNIAQLVLPYGKVEESNTSSACFKSSSDGCKL